MVKLSIIVPIYRVEQYLRKCVDSLLNQDIGNYEIILVDDGSPDACPQICDEYASRSSIHSFTHSPIIRVVHRKNGGLSAARNSGIEVAQGDYIMFVDSDDYIEPNVLGELFAQIDKDKLDVLRYNFRNINENYEEFHPNKNPKRDVDLSETVVDGETFLNERLGPGCYAWQFIIRRSIIVKNEELRGKSEGCSFKEGIYFEDTEWTPRMLMRAKRGASTKKVVYNYLWRSGSITLPTDPIKRKKVIDDKIALIRGFKEQQKLVKDPMWYVWMTSFTTMSILGVLVKMPSFERKPYIQELKAMQIFPLSLKREKMFSHKVKIILANISPSLYCYLMSIRI